MAEPNRPTSPRGDAGWERELEHLRERYRRKLQRELVTLGESLAEARRSQDEAAALDAARQLAHRLKGTAGSYGLDESCAALARIEASLERLLEPAPRNPGALWAEIERSLAKAPESLWAGARR